jgi:hypothetical protein
VPGESPNPEKQAISPKKENWHGNCLYLCVQNVLWFYSVSKRFIQQGETP